MDASCFDRLTRALSHAASRRKTLVAFLVGIVGLPTLADADVAARKKRKKKKKVKFNDFGCVNFGNFCKNSGQCCSGICQGKKGKKKCKAHDTGDCQAGQQEATCGGVDVPCTISDDLEGVCDTTTGNAGYCTGGGDCFACAKDADCQEFCGPAAACMICADFCAETGGTACVGPDECTFPPEAE